MTDTWTPEAARAFLKRVKATYGAYNALETSRIADGERHLTAALDALAARDQQVARLLAALDRLEPHRGLKRCDMHDRLECLRCEQRWPREIARDEDCRACIARAVLYPQEGE